MDRGAHFHKCDFQVHTPRDQNWAGKRPVSDAERLKFAVAFVRACRKKGLSAVAITDHHDMAFLPFIRQAAAIETANDGTPLPDSERLAVFPGMELTLGIPCQALLIFDADLPTDWIESIQTALTIQPVPTEKGSTGPVEPLGHIKELATLKSELDKYSHLKDRYIILPNVSKRGEHTLLKKGHTSHYKDMPCVGAYVDGPIAGLQPSKLKILQGKNAHWGAKKVAVFQTSDSRNADFSKLGQYVTWVKWATPTAEALRQACLASQSRIAHQVPAVPSTAIIGIRISTSTFLGHVTLQLNRQYNAIIGGRGTGKSTILEYLRWALCDEPPLSVDDDEAPNYHARRAHLVDKTLAPVSGSVEVRFLVNDIPHVVRRSPKQAGVQLKIGDGSFDARSEREIRHLLPIQSYSQKQLSRVGVRLEELKRFVTSPIHSELSTVQQSFDDLAETIREVSAQMQRKRALESTIAANELTVSSLKGQATQIRKKLTGLSKRDREVIAQKPSYDEAEHLVSEWLDDLERAGEAAEAFRSDLTGLPSDNESTLRDFPKSEFLDEMQQLLTQLFDNVDGMVGQIENEISAFSRGGSAFSKLRRRWTASLRAFEKRYATATARSEAHKERLEALEEVEGRFSQARRSLSSRQAELAKLGDPVAEYRSLRGAWRKAYGARHKLLEKQCTALTNLSGGEIRAELKKGAGFEGPAVRLRDAVARSGLRKAKIDSVKKRVTTAEDPVQEWERILDDLADLANVSPDDESQFDQLKISEFPGLADCSFSLADLQKVASRLTWEGWTELAVTPIEDEPAFSYRTREAEYIPFEVASAGQQATALLRTLLNQPGPPLVIDQPEDDLDNQVIPEIAEQIWSAKSARQLIFASHNANLVVNGDAELVVCCDYLEAGDQSAGQVKLTGAIDVGKVRTEITRIMEGGEAAFKLRADKYGF